MPLKSYRRDNVDWTKESCVQSYTCLHNALMVCGFDAINEDKKWFLDECDMHEFNCDSNKSFVVIGDEECEHVPPVFDFEVERPHHHGKNNEANVNPENVNIRILGDFDLGQPALDNNYDVENIHAANHPELDQLTNNMDPFMAANYSEVGQTETEPNFDIPNIAAVVRTANDTNLDIDHDTPSNNSEVDQSADYNYSNTDQIIKSNNSDGDQSTNENTLSSDDIITTSDSIVEDTTDDTNLDTDITDNNYAEVHQTTNNDSPDSDQDTFAESIVDGTTKHDHSVVDESITETLTNVTEPITKENEIGNPRAKVENEKGTPLTDNLNDQPISSETASIPDEKFTDSETEIMTEMTTESSKEPSTHATPESTTESSTTETTTESPLELSTDTSPELKTESTTESTLELSTDATQESMTVPSKTKPSRKSTQELPTDNSSEFMSESTTESTLELSTDATQDSKTELSTSEPNTEFTLELSTDITQELTTEPSTTETNTASTLEPSTNTTPESMSESSTAEPNTETYSEPTVETTKETPFTLEIPLGMNKNPPLASAADDMTKIATAQTTGILTNDSNSARKNSIHISCLPFSPRRIMTDSEKPVEITYDRGTSTVVNCPTILTVRSVNISTIIVTCLQDNH